MWTTNYTIPWHPENLTELKTQRTKNGIGKRKIQYFVSFASNKKKISNLRLEQVFEHWHELDFVYVVVVFVRQQLVCAVHELLPVQANSFEQLSHVQQAKQSLAYSIDPAIVAVPRLILRNLETEIPISLYPLWFSLFTFDIQLLSFWKLHFKCIMNFVYSFHLNIRKKRNNFLSLFVIRNDQCYGWMDFNARARENKIKWKMKKACVFTVTMEKILSIELKTTDFLSVFIYRSR